MPGAGSLGDPFHMQLRFQWFVFRNNRRLKKLQHQCTEPPACARGHLVRLQVTKAPSQGLDTGQPCHRHQSLHTFICGPCV